MFGKFGAKTPSPFEPNSTPSKTLTRLTLHHDGFTLGRKLGFKGPIYYVKYPPHCDLSPHGPLGPGRIIIGRRGLGFVALTLVDEVDEVAPIKKSPPMGLRADSFECDITRLIQGL